MDKKIKLIAIVLAGLCLGALGLAFSYISKFNSLTRDYQQLEKEKQTLHQENNKLAQKASNAQEEAGRLKEKEASMQKEMDRLSSERDDLQIRFDKLSEDRDRLTDKLEKSLARPQDQEKAEGGQPQALSGDEYWAGVLRQKEDLEIQLVKLKESVQDNQLKMSEAAKDKTELDLENKNLTKEKEDLQRKLEYNEKMSDSFSLQLVRERDNKRKLEKQLKLVKEENYALRSRLKEVMSAKLSVEKRLKDTESKRLDLYSRLNQMDIVLQDKLSAVLDSKQDLSDIKKGALPVSSAAVELSPIVVRSQASLEESSPVKEDVNGEAAPEKASAITQEIPQAQEGINVTIRSINEENGFVVLDAGQRQGLQKGQILHVYQGTAQTATLEVIKVSLNVCAADIKNKKAQLKIGDAVRP